jgi:hypothetical protein
MGRAAEKRVNIDVIENLMEKRTLLDKYPQGDKPSIHRTYLYKVIFMG